MNNSILLYCFLIYLNILKPFLAILLFRQKVRTCIPDYNHTKSISYLHTVFSKKSSMWLGISNDDNFSIQSVITSHIFPDRVAFCLNFPSFISNYVLYVCTCIYDQKLKTSSLTFLEMIFQILLYVK